MESIPTDEPQKESESISEETLKNEHEEEAKHEFVKVKLFNFEVKFPFEPYELQKDYMACVLRACHKQENALLESPTGTGKTLSLLCASLEWLEQYNLKNKSPQSKSNYKMNISSLISKSGDDYQEDDSFGQRSKIIY